MAQETNTPAAAFAQEGDQYDGVGRRDEDDREELEMGGATVEDDHPRNSGMSEEVKAQAEAYKESRPDPRDAENVPDHDCDHPDAPWM